VGLGRDAPVHQPDPAGLAVAGLDLGEEGGEGRAVRRVARQHLVGEREALGGDHEREHHLDAVRPVVPAVAEAAGVALVVGRVALEVGAREIVEEEVVGHPEEILPAAGQEREEVGLVGEQLVEAPVQRVLRHAVDVLPQQVAHRAVVNPLPVESPLAPGGEQPVRHQEQQDVVPRGPLPAGREPVAPELVELQVRPELTDDPAGTPLPRAFEAERAEAELHPDVRGMRRDRPVGREQGQAELAVRAFLDGLDAAQPTGLLAVVDLAQVQEVPIDRPAVGAPVLLGDAPVPMLLAVFDAGVALQVHGGRSVAQFPARAKGVGLDPAAFSGPPLCVGERLRGRAR